MKYKLKDKEIKIILKVLESRYKELQKIPVRDKTVKQLKHQKRIKNLIEEIKDRRKSSGCSCSSSGSSSKCISSFSDFIGS